LKSKNTPNTAIIAEEIRENEYYVRYRKIHKRLSEDIDLNKIDKELTTLHSGRMSRSLFGSSPGPDKIIEANLQDSSYRSRLVELRVELSKSITLMETTIDSLKIRMSTDYSDNLSGLKTKGERVSFIESFLVSGITSIEKMTGCAERIELVIKDIDQTAYTYKNAIQVLELVYSRNNDKKL
jgi:hypothetical protein